MEPADHQKSWVEKLRELPEERKKAVLIMVVAICAAAILPLEIFFTTRNIQKLSRSVGSINFPAFSVPSSAPQLPDLNSLEATPDSPEDDQSNANTLEESPDSGLSPDASPAVSPEASPTQEALPAETPQQFWGDQ